MPIKPENIDRYPANWLQIRFQILERAGHRCECRGECGDPHWVRCCAPDRVDVHRPKDRPWLWGHTGHREPTTKIILTIAHLDHTPENNDPSNLRAMCQRCHLRYDREHHARTRAETRRKALEDAGQETLL